MQAQSSESVNSFSIGFHSKKFNEADLSRAVAKHLGTNHTDLFVSDRDALELIPFLSDIYDEPFGDSSQIPTYFVSKLAKQKVSVALTGDAGDELFGGYNRYIFSSNFYDKIKLIPIPLRNVFSKLILMLNEEAWDAIFDRLLESRFANVGAKLHKGAKVLSFKSIKDLHYRLVSNVDSPSEWLIHTGEHKTFFNDNYDYFNDLDPINKMMAFDLMTYLPSDILTKIDRAAMSVSLETRLPFLDPKIIEFSASLPINFKIRNGVSKFLLRELLYKHVPKELIERPKRGFGVDRLSK